MNPPRESSVRARSSNRNSSVAREAALMLLARVVSALATMAVAIVLANALGPTEFGRYRLAITALGVTVLVSAQGLPAATGRFLVKAPDDPHRLAVLRQTATVTAILAACATVVLAAAAVPLAHLVGAPGAWPLFLVAALGVPGSHFSSWMTSVFMTTRQATAILSTSLVKSAAELGLVAVLVAVGVGAVGGVIAYSVAFGLTSVLGAYLLFVRWHGPHSASGEATTRAILRFGRQVWFADLSYLGFQTVDQVILQALKGTHAVGLYDIAWQLTAGLGLLSGAIAGAVAPRLMDPDRQFANQLFARAMGALTSLYAAIGVMTALLGGRLVDALFHDSFTPSGRILQALAPYVLLLGLAPLVSTGINYLGVARARMRIAVTALIVNAVIDVIAIKQVGQIGPTIGTGVAFAYYVLAHTLLYGDTDVRFPWRRVAISLARGTVAGLGGSGVALLVLHQTGRPGTIVVLGIGLLGAVFAALILIALREYDRTLWHTLRESSP
jgi:O-antigen/teichoic acid export membrane protein